MRPTLRESIEASESLARKTTEQTGRQKPKQETQHVILICREETRVLSPAQKPMNLTFNPLPPFQDCRIVPLYDEAMS